MAGDSGRKYNKPNKTLYIMKKETAEQFIARIEDYKTYNAFRRIETLKCEMEEMSGDPGQFIVSVHNVMFENDTLYSADEIAKIALDMKLSFYVSTVTTTYPAIKVL